MSLFTLPNLQNHPSRNGFDLSAKVAYTAKAGELLPIKCIPVMPGDKIRIKPQWFTRSQPVNSAAYARIREYYDFFFVPTRLLWRYFGNFIMNVKENNISNYYGLPNKNDSAWNNIPTYHPWFSMQDLVTYIQMLRKYENDQPLMNGLTNNFGYSRADLTCKLLSYLGYGSYSDFMSITKDTIPSSAVDGGTTAIFIDNPMLNPFPLLAYHKIYSDYYRFMQWQTDNPALWNVDYLMPAISDDGVSSVDVNDTHLDLTKLIPASGAPVGMSMHNFLDMEYCNFNKDYFTGLLPNSQLGDVAVASPVLGNLLVAGGTLITGSNTGSSSQEVRALKQGIITATNTLPNGSGVNTAGLSVLALRQAEFLQKYREIAQTGNPNYKSQVKKIFGVDVPDVHSNLCSFVGSVSSNLDISQVLNTNLTGDNQADIQGYGISTGDGYIEFDNTDKSKDFGNEHGYLMVISRKVPIVDYQLSGIRQINLSVTAQDYANPMFDRVGLQDVKLINLCASRVAYGAGASSDKPLGYAPRYLNYKTDYDEIKGAFTTSLPNWVAPLIFDGEKGNIAPSNVSSFLKVNPAYLNSIFLAQADANVDSDQFLCNVNLDIKAVRNLDVDGLPY